MTNDTTAKRRTVLAHGEDMMESSPTMVSPAVADVIRSGSVERINERELTSIYALLSYVSYNQDVQQETVQMIVEAEFGVDNVAKLRRDDYMRAIEFLVDLRMDEVMN